MTPIDRHRHIGARGQPAEKRSKMSVGHPCDTAVSDAPAFTDAVGVAHRPCRGDARIVSLVPSITECLIDLGLAQALVGRTSFCVHPEHAVRRIARIGGTKTPRIDRILALAPTHVIVNVDENRLSDAAALRDAGVQVVTTHPLVPEDNLALYRLLGGIFSVGERAAALAEAFRSALETLEHRGARARRRTVLYLIWRDPWMTVARDTYISRMLALAGLDTFEPDSDERYPRVEMTAGSFVGVDLILLSSEPFPFKARHAAEIRRELGSSSPAIRFIDAEMTSWYGSRAVRGCRYLEAFIDDLET